MFFQALVSDGAREIETITVAPLGSHVVKKSDTALIVLQLFQHGDQFSDKKVGWGSLEARGPYS